MQNIKSKINDKIKDCCHLRKICKFFKYYVLRRGERLNSEFGVIKDISDLQFEKLLNNEYDIFVDGKIL